MAVTQSSPPTLETLLTLVTDQEQALKLSVESAAVNGGSKGLVLPIASRTYFRDELCPL